MFTGNYSDDPLANSSVWRTGADPAFPLPADWPPVPVSEANPIECDFRNAGVDDESLVIYPISVNGIAEYTASNFSNELKGNLFAVGYNDNRIYRVELNQAGDQVLNGEEIYAENFGIVSLDITTLGDDGPFPGTMWVTGFNEHAVYIFEPGDYDGGEVPTCTGDSDPLIDEDDDGYNNEDEIQNSTDPCSAASQPADNDDDFISDLNDPDDDNDSVNDVDDAFALDAANGTNVNIPLDYPLLNEDPATGFFGLGFMGLMTNGTTDYLDQFLPDELIPGGTAGLFTVTLVPEGDATGSTNTQENAFQFGVNVDASSGDFSIKIRLPGPFFNGVTPEDDQSQGIYIGTGDMDNYTKLALHANGGAGGMQVVREENGVILSSTIYDAPGASDATNLDLIFSIDPASGSVQPSYVIDDGGLVLVGDAFTVSGDVLAALQGNYEVQSGIPSALAIGVIATSAGPGDPFDATWDFIQITEGATIPSSLTAAPENVIFSTVPLGGSSAQTLTLTNTQGNQKIDIIDATISGADAADFSHTFDEAVLLSVGASTSFDLTFEPSSVGDKTAQLTFTHSGSNNPLVIDLSGSGSEVGSSNPILFRVNAGGPLLLDGTNPVWQEDQSVGGTSGDAQGGTPHPFVNASENGDKTFGRNDPVTLSATIPEGTPAELFQRARWDASAAPHMQWNIPIAIGKTIEVRLYFAEQLFEAPNNPSWATWPRLYDVEIEGVLYSPLDNLDMFTEYGHDVGFMKSFVVVSDGNVDIDLRNVSGDPMIAGIEIVELTNSYSSVLEGWNLIGIPVTPDDANYEEVFSDVSPEFAPYKWENGQYVFTEDVAGGQAFWLSTTATSVQSYAGTGIEALSLDLEVGWNMIAGPACPVAFDAISDPSNILVSGTLFAYREGYVSVDTVEPGQGYWVNTSGSGSITLDCATAGSIASKYQSELALDDFGVLSISDASGSSKELFFGGHLDADVDRRRFSMPPSAPPGIFDVRFAGSSWLEEGDNATASLKGVTYPVYIEISRMAADYDGVAIVEQIVDGVVESQPMLSGDVLTIEDDRVTAVRVRSMSSVQAELPEQFTLQGNYPNPFNPQTTVVFDLPEAASVRITVFDLLGRRVLEAPAVEVSAGAARQLTVDASSLASGTYLYHVRADMAAGSEVLVGRMTLLK